MIIHLDLPVIYRCSRDSTYSYLDVVMNRSKLKEITLYIESVTRPRKESRLVMFDPIRNFGRFHDIGAAVRLEDPWGQTSGSTNSANIKYQNS
jgi:hypothetical protein